MIDQLLKMTKEFGPFNALAVMAILCGIALSSGLLDLVTKQSVPSLANERGVGAGIALAGLACLAASFLSRKEQKESKTIADNNWKLLLLILERHRALSSDDKGVFPSRVVQSLFKLRSELDQYLEKAVDDEVATQIARRLQYDVMVFCSMVEQIERTSRIKLNTDIDTSIESLSEAEQELFAEAHNRCRDRVLLFVTGISLGRGEATEINFLSSGPGYK